MVPLVNPYTTKRTERYRCDLGRFNDGELADLPQRTRHIYPKAAQEYWRCVEWQGPTARQPAIACAEPKANYRYAGQVELGDPGDPYPGQADLQRRADQRCQGATGDSNAVGTIPHRAVWYALPRSTCYTPD